MALGNLPQLGIVSYAGYVFNETTDTTLYRVSPRYDAARRTVTACEFTIGLKWTVANNGGTAAEVRDMVARLTKSGEELRYEGRGFGNEAVNRGVVRDVNWGPHAGDVTLKPVGAGRAVEAEWQVTFTIPTCHDAVFTGVLEWNFGVTYSIDADAVTTRTIRGHLIIANNRARPGDRAVTRSADTYRAAVTPGLLRGFKREAQEFTLSLDKSKLDYTFTDKEIGANAPGDGILSAEASESITSVPGKDRLVRWVKTFRTTYTIEPGRSVDVAWKAFFATIADRMKEARTRIPRVVQIPVNFTAEDPSVYGPRQKVSLAMTYEVIDAYLVSALGATGLWKPVPGSDYRIWANSTAASFGPRGSVGLRFDVGDDKLIDLCRAEAPPVSAGGAGGGVPGVGPGVGIGGALTANLFPAPAKDASWLRYEVHTRVVLDTGAMVVKTLPEEPLERAELRSDAWNIGRTGKLPAASGGALPAVVKRPTGSLQASFPGQNGVGDTTVQHRVTPTVHVYVTGVALRYGYDIPHPQLISVDGFPATLITDGTPGEGFTSGVTGNAIYPVFRASWKLHYVVPGLKASPGALPNPIWAPPG